MPVLSSIGALSTPTISPVNYYPNLDMTKYIAIVSPGLLKPRNSTIPGGIGIDPTSKIVYLNVGSNGGSVNIDWGDGSIQTVADGNNPVSHTYAYSGQYAIQITSSTGYIWVQNDRRTIDVISWGNQKFYSMYKMFGGYGLNDPMSIGSSFYATGTPNTSECVNMDWLFSYSPYDTSVDNWNTSNVTSMIGTFYGGNTAGNLSYNKPLNNWNVSKVTDMTYMFADNYSFNQPLNNWNVSNVSNMSGLFSGTQSFNQPLNNWNVGNVSNMYGTFNDAFSFNQDLTSWKTGLTAQPTLFSDGANPTWVASKATKFPFLSNGTTRINT
jgi:surface protein